MRKTTGNQITLSLSHPRCSQQQPHQHEPRGEIHGGELAGQLAQPEEENAERQRHQPRPRRPGLDLGKLLALLPDQVEHDGRDQVAVGVVLVRPPADHDAVGGVENADQKQAVKRRLHPAFSFDLSDFFHTGFAVSKKFRSLNRFVEELYDSRH